MTWKHTLNLPSTSFPMRANLVKREPAIQERWEELGLYERIRELRAGAAPFVLHDGPPYANGDVHIGTVRNKVLKDMTVRYHTMRGKDAPYVPGWDCHGLPIEHKILEELGPEGACATPLGEIRRRCRAYAEKYVDVQKKSFRRFGVLGDWERPYLTMDTTYEAGVLDVFASLVEKGFVTRGQRSIHWCVECRTALAEAEIEYGPEMSTSIHVRFAVEEEDARRLGGESLDVVIWTTTPWTIPANVAVALHPALDYAVVLHDGPQREQRVLVALPLVESYLEAVGGIDHKIPVLFKGRDLEGVRLRHPLIPREIPVVLAEYVSDDEGTGCVHTAPGHGADDFDTGVRERLPIICPVGPDGVYTEEVAIPSLVGVHIKEADSRVVALLEEAGALAATAEIEHSYPHCWRCKGPLCFRATDQWFVRVDHARLRNRALDICEDTVRWTPSWGRQRIGGMLRDRPDWCISRQRAWGVPIPAVYCENCGTACCTADLVRHVRDVVAREGSDAWFERDVGDLVPPGLACPTCVGTTFRKETDIFDVWFESGSSWRSVLTEERGLSAPADVYLEGHDQHRGWFQLSLLPAVAVTGQAPFRTCVTHGFFIDETGDKVSKSRGGMREVAPETILGEVGVDVVRLFFVSGNYFDDVPVSRRLIDPAAEQYRKTRNTLRFLLGGLGDFDPRADAVIPKQMLAVDRWVLRRLDQVVVRVEQAYDGFDIHKVSSLLRDFMDHDLSAFYLDLAKDRLYCSDRDGVPCRSARTALFRLALVLTKLWAPILVHTCEEAWDAMPEVARRRQSVHLEDWPAHGTDDGALHHWVEVLRRVRTEVEKRVDPLRKAGDLSSAYEVEVRYAADGEIERMLFEVAETYLDEHVDEGLREMMGVAEFLPAGRPDAADEGLSHPVTPTDLEGLSLWIGRTTHHRCDRCRRHRSGVAESAGSHLCKRCRAWKDEGPGGPAK